MIFYTKNKNKWVQQYSGAGHQGGSLPNGIALLDQEIAGRGREINTYSLNQVFRDIRAVGIYLLSTFHTFLVPSQYIFTGKVKLERLLFGFRQTATADAEAGCAAALAVRPTTANTKVYQRQRVWQGPRRRARRRRAGWARRPRPRPRRLPGKELVPCSIETEKSDISMNVSISTILTVL